MARRSVEAHAALVASLLWPAIAGLGAEEVALADALGRVAALDIATDGPLPRFRNAQMDGYAGRAAELAGAPVALPVDGVQPAAAADRRTLATGHLVKVMTGAPLPDGADCVVRVEDTEPDGAAVRVRHAPAAGEYVREAGSDAPAGTVVVPARTRLAARHLAAAAAAGVAVVAVRRRLRVAVLTTGAEVVPVGTPLRHGQVHDVNGVALASLLAESGAVPVLVALTPDDRDAFAAVLRSAVASADLVVTAGGISKGDYEVVRQVLEPLGADVTEVAMQPGGPQATAVVDGVPVVCLPGNPVSVQVSFIVFLRALLREAAGLPPVVATRLPLAADVEPPAGKRQWLRGRVVEGAAAPVGGPGSHLVTAMAAAEVLIDVPMGAGLPAGTPVDVLPL